MLVAEWEQQQLALEAAVLDGSVLTSQLLALPHLPSCCVARSLSTSGSLPAAATLAPTPTPVSVPTPPRNTSLPASSAGVPMTV